MSDTMEYLKRNKALWEARTKIHLESEFYGMEQFLAGANSLREIEGELLGELEGLSVLHLQCHFGQDTLSLARMGAEVTGMDLSEESIATARELSEELGLDARFICCDLYDLPNHLNDSFDIVFTSYGVIGWLPDLDRWAEVIAHFMHENSRFVIVEFHPFLWMHDDAFRNIKYSYFNTGPIHESEEGTYADWESEISEEFVCWNHSLGETVNALIRSGMDLQALEEYNYSPWDIFPDSEEKEPGRFILPHFGDKVPLVFSLTATI